MSRKEATLFRLAVAASFTLHGALLLLLPASQPHRSRPRLQMVAVDLLGTPRPEPPRGEAPPQDSPTAPDARPAGTAESPARPSPSSAAVETRRGTGGAALLSRAARRPPDPGGGAAEVTLSLDDDDLRYRAYLDRVRAAIFGSWRVGSALLVAGGPRKAVLRFTLGRAGIVEDEVEVVRTSGNPVLDQRAVEGVQRAPVPPFPDDWTLERLNLFAEFEVVFQ